MKSLGEFIVNLCLVLVCLVLFIGSWFFFIYLVSLSPYFIPFLVFGLPVMVAFSYFILWMIGDALKEMRKDVGLD